MESAKMNPTDKFLLKLSKSQQRELTDKCGFNPKTIITSPLSLIKFSLAATAANSQSLPFAKDITTAFSAFNKSDAERPYSFTLKLTAHQRRMIKEVVGKEWFEMMIFPDEHEVTYGERWETSASQFRFGRFLVTVSEDNEQPRIGVDEVIFLPKNGGEKVGVFGTGQHGATRASLMLLEKYLQPGKTVLDAGTGSGILAVAAARLGAGSILAFDIDHMAVSKAQQVVELNRLEDKIEVLETQIEKIDRSFDLIIANIFPKVIISLRGEFYSKLNDHGLLIASGIVTNRADSVVRKLEQTGFKAKDFVEVNNWTAIILEKVNY